MSCRLFSSKAASLESHFQKMLQRAPGCFLGCGKLISKWTANAAYGVYMKRRLNTNTNVQAQAATLLTPASVACGVLALVGVSSSHPKEQFYERFCFGGFWNMTISDNVLLSCRCAAMVGLCMTGQRFRLRCLQRLNGTNILCVRTRLLSS